MSYLEKWSWVVRASEHIFTWSEPETLAYLAEAASQSKLAAESGTYMGRSARVMLDANPNLMLWCIDKFMVVGTEHVTRYFLKDRIAAGHCEVIVGDSLRGAAMLRSLQLDFVFVDDGHAEEDLQRDIACLLPLLKPGGLLIGHDFDVPHNDVARGVLSMLPLEELTFPVPRVWQYRKPA